MESGAEINARDKYKQTPFHRAVLRGQADVIKYLLSTGSVQVNAQDVVGNSALHIACEEESEEIVKLLLNAGATTELQNREKKTPLDLVVNHSLRKSFNNLFNQAASS